MLLHHGGGAPGSERKKEHKFCWVVRSWGGGVTLVVVVYLQVSQVADLDSCTIVGNFSGRRFTMETLISWVQ
jgi:hypothetical protein